MRYKNTKSRLSKIHTALISDIKKIQRMEQGKLDRKYGKGKKNVSQIHASKLASKIIRRSL